MIGIKIGRRVSGLSGGGRRAPPGESALFKTAALPEAPNGKRFSGLQLFGRDLVSNETDRSARLYERHIGDADKAQDVPKIGDYIVIGFQARSCVITPSTRHVPFVARPMPTIALQSCRWPDPITSRCSKAAVELAEFTLAGISSWSAVQFERPIGSNHVNISLPR
jgi:hypothetical protein